MSQVGLQKRIAFSKIRASVDINIYAQQELSQFECVRDNIIHFTYSRKFLDTKIFS